MSSVTIAWDGEAAAGSCTLYVISWSLLDILLEFESESSSHLMILSCLLLLFLYLVPHLLPGVGQPRGSDPSSLALLLADAIQVTFSPVVLQQHASRAAQEI